MRIQSIISFLTAACLLVSALALAQISNVIMAPVEFRQDFEEGHISGWESYPPFQDSAFDPDFKCNSENNLPGSRYALTRRVQIGFPTKYEIGFIRKVHLYVTKSSTVSFRYLLKMFGDTKTMEAVVCGMDGKRYTYTIPSPTNDQWQTATVPATSFMSGKEALSPGKEMEAFYVLAHIERTNPDVAYRFYLDNVVITGEAPVQFHVLAPNATVLEHWNKTVLHKHYTAGEALSLTVSVPSPVSLTSTTFSLTDPHGKEVLDEVALSFHPEANLWERPMLYTFSESNEKGRWQGRLWGEDGNGRHVETRFDVWVTDKSQPHPRLYFGTDNAAFYKRRLEDPKWKSWFDTLAAKALRLRTTSNLGSIVFGAETSSLRVIPPTQWTIQSMAQVDLSGYDTTYLLPTLSHYFGIMVPAMDILYDHALLYAFRGDRDAGEYGKNALLAIAGWKTWTHPWFRARHQESYYPVGELGVRAAFCYDVVYPLLNSDERKTVQDGLLRSCVIPVYQEYVVEDRIPSSTSNWIGNSVSGALSCILAMYGDNPNRGDFEPYLSGLLTKLEEHIHSTLDTSGAWGEGIGYQSFAYSNTLPTITALNRVLHTDITTPALLRSYLYFLYNSSRAEVLDVGDSHPTLSSLSSFAWILSKTDDPVFRWSYRMAPRDHALDFLFGRENGPAIPPDTLPTSKLFSDIGGAVFRSGWTPDDLVMSFRCGAFFNHQHFHQGSFQLSAFGEALIPEAGVAHYYNDPWYPLYFIQAIGHNTVLVDGNPGSQRSGDYLHFVKAADERAEMQEFIGTEYYGAATGELHKLYRGNLKLFERNIIFIQPEYFVVFDRIRSSGNRHAYNWLLHCDDRKDVNVSGSDITIEREQASLLAKVLSPVDAVIEVKGAPVRLSVPITRPGFLQVSNVGKSTEENFLVVLYPKKKTAQDRDLVSAGIKKLSNAIESLHGKNYVGTRIVRGGAEDEILFRIDENEEKIDDGHVATDGRIVARTVRGNQLVLLAVHDATSLTFDPAGWLTPLTGLTGTSRFTAAAAFHGDTSEWHIQADTAGTITFHLLRKPLEVNLNGVAMPSFSWDGENCLLTVIVAEGTNRLTVHF
jgi:hypothetical protein